MVDYSFIADASPAPAAVPYNPLGMATQLQQLQNLQTENQLNRQNILNSQLTNRTGQAGLNISQTNRMAQAAMSVLGESDLSGDKGTAAVKAAVDADLAANPGPESQRSHDIILSTLPPARQADGSPTPDSVFRGWAKQHGQLALSALEQYKTNMPSQGPDINTPQGGLQGTMRAPQSSATPYAVTPVGPATQQGPSPDNGWDISTLTLPNGTTVTGTKFQHISNGYLTPAGQPAPGVTVGGDMSGDDYAKRVTGSENPGGNPAQKNTSGPGGTPTSSAMGDGQFTEQTWLNTIKEARPDLVAGKTDAQILAMRSDPTLSAQMTGALAKNNAPILQKAGVPVNAASLYIAHAVGAQGAVSILSANPLTPLSKVLSPAAMAANPQFAGKTVGELTASAVRRMGTGGVSLGATGGGSSAQTGGAAPAAQPASGIVIPAGQLNQQKIDQDLYHAKTIGYNNSEANLIANYKEAYTLGHDLATGSGTQWGADMAARIVSLGRAFNVTVGPLADKVQARAELDKVLNQILVGTPGANRSDASLGTSTAGQPHMGMDTAAMLNQIRLLYGQTKQANAAMLAHDPATNGVGYQKAERDMMSTTGREGFASDLFTPQEIQARLKLLGGATSTAGKAFLRGLNKNKEVYKAEIGSGLQ